VVVLGVLGVEPMPLPELDPMPLELPVLEPLDVPPLVEPLPIEPLLVPVEPDVPPAPLEVEPCCCRQRSLSSPVSASQLDEPTPEEDAPTPPDEELPMPLEDEPVSLLLVPAEGELLLVPAEGELLLPLRPPVPLVLPEVCAYAESANNAAAVAETMSFRFMLCAPLGGWNCPVADARAVPPACRQRGPLEPKEAPPLVPVFAPVPVPAPLPMPVLVGPLGGVVEGAAFRASCRQRSRSSPRSASQRFVTSLATGGRESGTCGVVKIWLPAFCASASAGTRAGSLIGPSVPAPSPVLPGAWEPPAPAESEASRDGGSFTPGDVAHAARVDNAVQIRRRRMRRPAANPVPGMAFARARYSPDRSPP
jgi:hypothetical protein